MFDRPTKVVLTSYLANGVTSCRCGVAAQSASFEYLVRLMPAKIWQLEYQ